MRCGLHLPTAGDFADVPLLTALACEAEAAGWDGFFVYDQIAAAGGAPLVDPWIALTAIALATTRLRLGPLVTPLARRRPWQVARETATLDQLCGGRLVLGVGLGSAREEFDDLGEAADQTVRAAMLDEALTLLTGLWSGEPLAHQGAYYSVRTEGFHPRPVQQPHIPIWVGGIWPTKAPFRRAARWDGVFPHARAGMITAQEVRDLITFIDQQRTVTAPLEVVVRNKAPSGDRTRDAARTALYAEAGVTWWLEGIEGRYTAAEVRRCVRQGPPTR